MGMSELGQKSKPGERGEAVEPRYNKTLYNEVLGIARSEVAREFGSS